MQTGKRIGEILRSAVTTLVRVPVDSRCARVADERVKRSARATQFFRRQAALASGSADHRILIVFLLSKDMRGDGASHAHRSGTAARRRAVSHSSVNLTPSRRPISAHACTGILCGWCPNATAKWIGERPYTFSRTGTRPQSSVRDLHTRLSRDVTPCRRSPIMRASQCRSPFKRPNRFATKHNGASSSLQPTSSASPRGAASARCLRPELGRARAQ
jgi:hypothetical protein